MMSTEEYVTELTLALPGTCIKSSSDGLKKRGDKRRFIETTVDLKVVGEGRVHVNNNYNISCNTNCEGLAVGWPPLKTVRRRKYVKVGLDGFAFLRKIDLELYHCYAQLFTALQNMFYGDVTSTCKEKERKGEVMATYEDKDGDLMLVGDVPWMMFVESCKRMRLMKIGDAIY